MAATSLSHSPEDSESTPLLRVADPALQPKHTTNSTNQHELVYQRFSARSKRFILAMVSFTGLIPLFISGTFVPCIPQISRDLRSTAPVISLAVSVSIFGASIGSLTASTYSTFYGRRPIYLTLLPLLIGASFGVASSRTVPELMVWRLFQAFGASPGLSVGAGVIGDIYRLEERGGAMGVFFACVLLGPALAPFIGGSAAQYSSWRALQVMLGLVAILIFILLYFCLPETSHPGERGVEKVDPAANWVHPKWRPVFLNPFRALALMKSPNLLLVSLASLFALLTDYVLLVPIAYTIGTRYGISNEALIGACFLPAGLGNMIGAPLAGRISDRIVTRWKAKRGGVWYPEDRLRATLPGALFLVPISIVLSGFITRYVEDKRIGLSLNLVCLFVNGLGVDFVLSPSAAYIVDVMHSRSAEGMGASNASRALVMAAFVAGILPMIEAHGVLVTDVLSGMLAVVGFGLLWITIRYGESLRKWGNIGYSTNEYN